MLIAVAGAIYPPHLSRRGPVGQCMEHGEHRGCADACTQQDDGAVAWPQREAAAWRAGVQDVASPNLSLDVGPGRTVGLPLDAQTIAIVAARSTANNCAAERARPVPASAAAR